MKFILIILAVLLAVVPVLHSSVGGTETNEREWLSDTGRWVPYTVDFIGSGPFYADDEQYSATLPANINSGDGIQFNCGGHWFNYELSGGKVQWWYIDKGKEGTKNIGSILSSQGVASGNNVTYQNAFWGTDARYTAHSYGLREVFILDALPSGVSVDWDETYLEYTGELTWDDGLSVWADGVDHPDKTFRTSGDIDFRDISTGESVFYIPAPTAWDSDGNTCNLVYDVKVSADKIQYGLRVPYEFLAIAVFPVYIDPDNWVSPTGHNDPDSKWVTEANAYDGDIGSSAANSAVNYDHYLELTIAAIQCDKVRIYARDIYIIGYDPDLDIDVYYSSAWHNIFSGTITNLAWVEKVIGSTQTVTKARIKSNTSDKTLRIYEFEFNLLLPIVETDACSGVQPTSFDANGDIIVSGGATTRGFHYSKVYDGFEWGNDEDPLDDSGGEIDWTILAEGSSKVEIDTAMHYSGTRSARLYCDGSNNAQMYFTKTGGISSDQVLSFCLKKGDTSYIAFWHSNGSKYIRLSVPTSELIYYYDGSSHSTGYYVSPYWCRLSFRNVNWSAGTYDIYKDGILIWTAATMATSASYANQTRFYNGGVISTSWIDQVAIWDVEDEDGSFGEGEYSLEITGLDSDTTYYVQAFAENAVGFGYGNVVSQLTLTVAGYSWGSVIG